MSFPVAAMSRATAVCRFCGMITFRLTKPKATVMVEDVGISETKDEHIWRVKWYCGLALFSELALSCADGITN